MKKILTLIALSVLTLSFGQDEESKFKFNGSVDAYWRSNINAPNDEVNEGTLPYAPPSSFVNMPGFSLGMANLVASYEDDKVGFVADLAYGPRADQAINPNGATNNAAINQMYMFWKVTENTTATMGRFNTFLGIERISPVENFNYSMSHAFTFGPRNHNGLMLDFKLKNNWTMKLAVMNPMEVTDFNNTGHYSVGGQIINGNFKFGYVRSQRSSFIDIVTGFDISDKIQMGLNAQFANYENGILEGRIGDEYTSLSIYPQYTASESMSWGVRLEYIAFGPVADSDVLSVVTPTLTANYQVGGLTIKPEFRLDSSSQDIFINNDGNGSGTLSSFVLGAVYSF
ncbi:porin [Flavobacteriaceae bacterium]|jgi:hypothetical protein|nr:porin [Flavobacteriaceae bacterium]MDA9576033.1 porin [Flavobacteriaceae bacterium]MDB2632054.1 porin [Flavobacteriaceae bacterium]